MTAEGLDLDVGPYLPFLSSYLNSLDCSARLRIALENMQLMGESLRFDVGPRVQ